MIVDSMSLTNICTSFEGVLHLEFGESTRTAECLDNAIKALENDYNIKIDKDIYTLQSENSLVSQQLDILLQSVTECMKMTALYTSLCTFHHSIPMSLAEANYLGFARERLMSSLKYFQDKDAYVNRKKYVEAIADALNTVAVCYTKRLCMILLMLERLGISEGVAVVAQLLYVGGFQ